MRQGSLADYISVMNNPREWFRTLKDVVPVTDKAAEPIVYVGNSAAAFKVTLRSDTMMLRCFTKQSERCRDIYNYLSGCASPLAGGVQLLKDEVFVVGITGQGQYYDVLISPWIEGLTLSTWVANACLEGNSEALYSIAKRFEVLALQLLREPWAHGDLKPANIMVDNSGELHLIDFDAIYAPTLGYDSAAEIGTRRFQHPARGADMYDKHIDDYPIAYILAFILLMAKSPNCYDQIVFENSLDPAYILSGCSDVYIAAKKSASEQPDIKLYRLLNALANPTPVIDDLENMISHVSFDCVMPACEGLSIAYLGGVNYFVDSDLSVIINASAWREVNNFSHGLAAVCKDGRWGYINSRGEVAIEVRFEMAASFRDSLALVRVQGKYGYIDQCGAWAIEPQYDYATSFRASVASVELYGKSFTIDKTGSIV